MQNEANKCLIISESLVFSGRSLVFSTPVPEQKVQNEAKKCFRISNSLASCGMSSRRRNTCGQTKSAKRSQEVL